MKNLYRQTWLTFCFSASLILVAGAASADIVTLTATLSGANEVPPNSSTAIGTAVLTLDNEGPMTGIPLYIEFQGLSSAQTGAHVHNGAAGVNGPVIHELPLGSPLNTSLDLEGLSEIVALSGGNLYVNIHTVEFPGGEIRGQLVISDVVDSDQATWGSIKSLYR